MTAEFRAARLASFQKQTIPAPASVSGTVKAEIPFKGRQAKALPTGSPLNPKQLDIQAWAKDPADIYSVLMGKKLVIDEYSRLVSRTE